MNQTSKLLFVINPHSGKHNTNFRAELTDHFKHLPFKTSFFEVNKDVSHRELRKFVQEDPPEVVIAVGGDGTVKLVAEALLHLQIPMGIVPAGSANGMAKEFGIIDMETAVNTIANGQRKKIHVVKINNEYCVHLSDLGFNAFVVRNFESRSSRGLWGYFLAGIKALRRWRKMDVSVRTDDSSIIREAAMVVIANATKYGTGMVINPYGNLYDKFFEVVIVKKLSLSEVFKMKVTHRPYDPLKTEVLQTHQLDISSKHRVHFQVDGEYRGRVKSIRAVIIPEAVTVIIPW
jgi:diacylglycerol kinase (ATP)